MTNALDTFRQRARQMKPTKAHRCGVWENMLGTIYAMNAAGQIEYFDYDYKRALEFVGPVEDVRVTKYVRYQMPCGATIAEQQGYKMPREGQRVWFVRTAA